MSDRTPRSNPIVDAPATPAACAQDRAGRDAEEQAGAARDQRADAGVQGQQAAGSPGGRR
ncbi:hypothetical protein [Streptomyces atratus]|uniref:Uncharacterized protein n=1 Tax=Streptomyces atratus TaxID=1893 RepID=A0A2Z5J6Z9_STRAR|nr:hypothetical protein [Streptomyces atratus]AXE76040.1 hypothetical protein C5746_02610 [Streptomyces atratus]